MSTEEREERLALQRVILAKLRTVAESKDREWQIMALLCMAWALCLQWDIRILNFWEFHLDWMLHQISE